MFLGMSLTHSVFPMKSVPLSGVRNFLLYNLLPQEPLLYLLKLWQRQIFSVEVI